MGYADVDVMDPIKKMLLRQWAKIVIRVLAALVLLGVSFGFMAMAASGGYLLSAFFPVLMSMVLLVSAAIVVAPPMTRAMVDKVGDFFMYSEKFDRAPPMYGKPAALRKSRQYEEAMLAYEEIAEDYPEEIRPYLEMIDMALRDLKDPERAESIYQQGVLSFEDAKDRERLARQLSGLRLRS